MPEMKDLRESLSQLLREWAARDTYLATHFTQLHLGTLAADEIERLRAELAEAHVALTEYREREMDHALLRAELAEGKRLVKKLSRWITQRGRGAPDHACLRCTPWEDSIVENFSCAYHDALDIEAQVPPCPILESAIGDKTSPDEHRAPAAAEKPA